MFSRVEVINGERGRSRRFLPFLTTVALVDLVPELLALKQESRILRQSSNTASGFSMMEQVRLCAVRPMENWLGSSMNHIQGWMTV